MRICVLGLGQVGLPTAKYILQKGLEVWGYDINPIAIERVKEKSILRATSNWHEIPSVDVYIICVSTFINKDLSDLSPVFDVAKKIAEKSNNSALVSIESTIIPGTSRKIYEEIFKKNIHLVHVPHRYWAGDPLKRGVSQLRVIGAVNKQSLKVGMNFYREILGIPLHVTPSIEVAEMCKITENAYRYVQIAFAEELKMICSETKLNFEETRKACNTKWNIEILEARDGINGHCLPKDIKNLASLSKYNTLLKSAVEVDKQYRKWLQNFPSEQNR